MSQPTNTETPKIAHKSFPCDACKWLKLRLNTELFNKMNPDEKKAVSDAKQSRFRIKRGKAYIEENGVYKNNPYTSRYIKEIHLINLKYGLYPYADNTNLKIGNNG